MAYQGIGTGTTPNDNNGDSLLIGAVKVNSNFQEIYSTFGDGTNLDVNIVAFPSGTAMLFQQTAAPTGWTKQTTHNDKSLRVVSGTAGSGGTTDFTSVFTSRTFSGTVGNTTLTTEQIPAHTHRLVFDANGSGPLSESINSHIARNSNNLSPYTLNTADSAADPTLATSSNTGGGNSHTHSFTGDSLDFAVAYVDVIIATKD